MLDTFLISYRLRNSYKVNGIIYTLKGLPLIKKCIPSSLYANRGLKIFATVLSGISEFFSMFAGKAFYLLLMVFLPALSNLMKSGEPSSFLNIFFFLTLAGAVLNTSLFNPSRDKYYAIVLMRMDAREYTLSNYIYFLLRMLIGFLPFSFVFGKMAGLDAFVCAVMPFYVVSIKLIAARIGLTDGKKKEAAVNENKMTKFTVTFLIVFLAAAYLLPFAGWAMTRLIFLLLVLICVIISVPCLIYLVNFSEYKKFCKNLLTQDMFMTNSSKDIARQQQKNEQKKLDESITADNTKSGYAYLNDIFMKRHSKVLTKSAKRIAIVSGLVLIVGLIACLLSIDIKQQVNEFIMIGLPYMLFWMYFINRGKVITHAMFLNCDHSMLAYRFYRQPKAILGLFAERLKSLVLINLLPASVFALGLPFLLFITGGTDNPFNYLVLVTSILAMSIFFSVHNLVLYYLLQPYNAELEAKNPLFSMANTITYIICYLAIGKRAPTLVFGALTTGFCAVYIIIALLLAYKLAPKTFKLRD